MTISNEDREAVAELLKAHGVDIAKPNTNYCVCGVKMSWGGGLCTHRLDVLIAHGWGPRPAVSREAIVDHVARLEVLKAPVFNGVLTICAESMADALIPFLRECGIEVTGS